MLLDPPFAQDALAIGLDVAHVVTLMALAFAAPVVGGAFVFGLALLWGCR